MVGALNNPQAIPNMPQASATASQVLSPSGPDTISTAALHQNPNSLKTGTETLIIDFDGSVVDLTNMSNKSAAKKEGRLRTVDSLDNPPRIDFILNTAFIEQIQQLKAKGHKVIFASNKLNNELLRDIIHNTAELKDLAEAYLGREEFCLDINYDHKQYPNSPTKISSLKKLGNVLYRFTVGPFKYLYDSAKSVFSKNSLKVSFMPPLNIEVYPQLASIIAKREAAVPSATYITADFEHNKSIATDYQVINAKDPDWFNQI